LDNQRSGQISITLSEVKGRLVNFVSETELGENWPDFLEHCCHHRLYRTGLRKVFPINPAAVLDKDMLLIVKDVINARTGANLDPENFLRFITGQN
jgi:hypothetical protein